MNYNPYEAPAIPYQQSAAGQMSQGAARELLGTQGWVRFVGVMMLIFTGLMMFSAVMGAVTAATYSSRFDGGYAGRRSFSDSPDFGPMLAILVVMALYLYPAILLSKYASAIKRFRFSGSMVDVEAALRHQRYFWRFTGIIFILCLAFFVVVMLVGTLGIMSLGRF